MRLFKVLSLVFLAIFFCTNNSFGSITVNSSSSPVTWGKDKIIRDDTSQTFNFHYGIQIKALPTTNYRNNAITVVVTSEPKNNSGLSVQISKLTLKPTSASYSPEEYPTACPLFNCGPTNDNKLDCGWWHCDSDPKAPDNDFKLNWWWLDLNIKFTILDSYAPPATKNAGEYDFPAGTFTVTAYSCKDENSANCNTSGEHSGSAQFTVGENFIKPIGIKIVQNLDFGAFIPNDGGTIEVNSSGRSTTNGVMAIKNSSYSLASFDISGEAGELYNFGIPNTVILTNGDNSQMTSTLTDVSVSGDTIGTDGISKKTVGGKLTVKAGQSTGAYKGTYTINVDYQ